MLVRGLCSTPLGTRHLQISQGVHEGLIYVVHECFHIGRT